MPPKVAFLMANYGHDPTGEESYSRQRRILTLVNSISETAVPYAEFKKAGFEIDFITEKGNMPVCDSKMLEGITQKLLVGYIMTYRTQDMFSCPLSVNRVPPKRPSIYINP